MALRSLLKMFAFSTHAFDAPGEAEALVDLLMGGLFAATRFGRAEPVREPLEGEGRAKAIALLRGPDGGQSGSVFLGGSKPAMTFTFDWRRGQSSVWYAQFDAATAGSPARCATLTAALSALFARFPAQFAGVAPSADWDARHWLREEFDDGGESITKAGLDLNGHLPGIFWWTLFGRQACEFFGRELLLSAPVAQAEDLGTIGGVALRADVCPQSHANGRLSEAEAAVRQWLGSDYFFDIQHPQRKGLAIPGVTKPGA
jgi:hypothetical protein